jgi:hypothetical protein
VDPGAAHALFGVARIFDEGQERHRISSRGSGLTETMWQGFSRIPPATLIRAFDTMMTGLSIIWATILLPGQNLIGGPSVRASRGQLQLALMVAHDLVAMPFELLLKILTDLTQSSSDQVRHTPGRASASPRR